MSENLMEDLCKGDGYYLNCFKISAGECRGSVQTHFAACAKKVKLPKKIDPFTDGVRHARKIGSCVGQQTDKKFAAKKITLPLCKSAQAWVQ